MGQEDAGDRAGVTSRNSPPALPAWCFQSQVHWFWQESFIQDEQCNRHGCNKETFVNMAGLWHRIWTSVQAGCLEYEGGQTASQVRVIWLRIPVHPPSSLPVQLLIRAAASSSPGGFEQKRGGDAGGQAVLCMPAHVALAAGAWELWRLVSCLAAGFGNLHGAQRLHWDNNPESSAFPLLSQQHTKKSIPTLADQLFPTFLKNYHKAEKLSSAFPQTKSWGFFPWAG